MGVVKVLIILSCAGQGPDYITMGTIPPVDQVSQGTGNNSINLVVP